MRVRRNNIRDNDRRVNNHLLDTILKCLLSSFQRKGKNVVELPLMIKLEGSVQLIRTYKSPSLKLARCGNTFIAIP